MKKMILFSTMLFALAGVVIAQDVVTPPDSILDVFKNLDIYLGSLAGLAAISTFFAAFFNGLLKITKKLMKQLVAWAVAIIIVIGTDLLNVGFAADFPILKAAFYGVGAGLVANGIFDVPFIKNILDKVEGWFTKPAV